MVGGLSGSLGGVLKGDTRSSSFSPAASGARVSLTFLSGVDDTVLFEKILGLPARLIGGGIGVEPEGGLGCASF